MSEIMLYDTASAHALNYVVLRHFNAAGATHLLKIVVEAATGQRAKIDVFGTDSPTPDGSCVRDFIHVTDLVQAHGAALSYLRAGRRLDRVELRLRPPLLGAGDHRGRAAGVRA
jgi:UDP-glucose 4-epimerase